VSRAPVLALVLICSALAFPSAAADVPAADGDRSAPLRIDEWRIVDIALRTHPSIEAMETAVKSARSVVMGSRLALVPDLSLTASYARLSNIPERYRTLDGAVFPLLLDSFSGKASLTVPLSDMFLSLAADVRAANRLEEATQLEQGITRARVAYEARMLYFAFWRRTLMVKAAEKAVQAAEANLRDQRARAHEGAVARNEVLPFETALDEAVVQLEVERSELAGAEAMLRAVAPELGSRPLMVPDEVPSSASVEALPPPSVTGSAPELAMLEQQVRAANERVKSAAWSALPKLILFGNADLSAPSPRVFTATKLEPVASWEAGAQIQWSLSQHAAGLVRSAQARQELAALEARREEARRQIQSRRVATLASLSAATARTARARDQVTRATALAKARRGELAAGTALPLAVVDAEADLIRATSESIAAYIAINTAYAELDFIEGRSSPNPLMQAIR
jgi:outer membrane protein TolC